MSGWRTALRLARREARRAKGRSTLVIAMIMLPVAAVSYLAVAYDTFTLTPDESSDRVMGTGQAQLSWQYAGPVQQLPNLLRPFPIAGTDPAKQTDATDERLLTLLPSGSRVLRQEVGSVGVHTATGIGTVRARMLDYADPLARGIYRHLSGRAPANGDEVALTPAAVDRLGVGIGGTVRLTGGARTLSVVGTVEDPGNLSTSTIVQHPRAQVLDGDEVTWLAGTPGPLTWSQVKDLNTHGVVALSRHVQANPPSPQEEYQLGVRFSKSDGPPAGAVTLIGGLAMLEIVLLAGPAFAVGARRRQRELALVAATGAAPRQIRRIVLADGVVLGSVAAVVGAAIGIAAAAATRVPVEEFVTYRSGDFRLNPVALAVVVGAAILTGVLAALVPAWLTSRQNVVTALAGRRGITRSRRHWPILGVVLAVGGVVGIILGARQAETTIALAGLIVFELGVVLCTPAIVGLVAKTGRLLPLVPRIALRDASRNRTAAASAISAVMAAVAGSMAAAVVLVAQSDRAAAEFSGNPGDVSVYASVEDSGNDPLSADVESAMRAALPIEQVHRVSLLECGGRDCFVRATAPTGTACPWVEKLGTLAADDERAARADPRCDGVASDHSYFGGSFSFTPGPSVVIEPVAAGTVANISAEDGAAAAAALRSGAVVVDDPRYVVNGQLMLAVETFGQDQPLKTVTARGFVLPNRPRAPITMMTKDTAASLGLGARPLLALATTTRIPTVAEEDRLQAALGGEFRVSVARMDESNQSLLILAIVAGVIALGAAGMATGLAAADSRADLGTLAAVGASPRLRRALSLSQSGIIAGLGSLLGAVAGLGASTAVLFTLNQVLDETWPAQVPYDIGIPWLNVAAAVVIVPALAMLGAGLLTRSRLPIERRL